MGFEGKVAKFLKSVKETASCKFLFVEFALLGQFVTQMDELGLAISYTTEVEG